MEGNRCLLFGTGGGSSSSSSRSSSVAQPCAAQQLVRQLQAGHGKAALALLSKVETLPKLVGDPLLRRNLLHVAAMTVQDADDFSALVAALRARGTRLLARCNIKATSALPLLSPMHMAVRANNPAAMVVLARVHDALLNGGAPNLPPLHYAVCRGQADAVVLLLRLGATRGAFAALRWLIGTNRAAALRTAVTSSSHARKAVSGMADAVFVAAAAGAPATLKCLLDPAVNIRWLSLGGGLDFDREPVGGPVQAAAQRLGQQNTARTAFSDWRRKATHPSFCHDADLPSNWSMSTANSASDAVSWVPAPDKPDYPGALDALAEGFRRRDLGMQRQRFCCWALSRKGIVGHVCHRVMADYLGLCRSFQRVDRNMFVDASPRSVLAVPLQRKDYAVVATLLRHGANPYETRERPTKAFRKLCARHAPGWCDKCTSLAAAQTMALGSPSHGRCVARLIRLSSPFVLRRPAVHVLAAPAKLPAKLPSKRPFSTSSSSSADNAGPLLFRRAPPVPRSQTTPPETPLAFATRHRQALVVRRLLWAKVRVDGPEVCHTFAAKPAMLAALMRSGAAPFLTPALQGAVVQQDAVAVTALVAAKAAVNGALQTHKMPGSGLTTPLRYALRSTGPESALVRALLDAKAHL
jgi:hypothetical protein